MTTPTIIYPEATTDEWLKGFEAGYETCRTRPGGWLAARAKPAEPGRPRALSGGAHWFSNTLDMLVHHLQQGAIDEWPDEVPGETAKQLRTLWQQIDGRLTSAGR